MHSHLSNNGWNRLFADPNIYVLHCPFGFTVLDLFVDDIPVVASHPAIIDIVHDMLASSFPISDKGPMDFFLGITVFRDPHGRFIKLSQSHYIMQILQEFDMHSANGQRTPLALNARLAPKLHPYAKADATALQDFKYNKLIGQLRYLITCTRLDLCYAGHILSRVLLLPRRIHRQAALRCLRYLKHTMHYSLIFHRQDGPLAFTGYVDADWAAQDPLQHSTLEYVFTLVGGAITWTSKLQIKLAHSSTEVEYVAASLASREVLWLSQLIYEMRLPIPMDRSSISLHCDNQSGIALASAPQLSSNTPHISIAYHALKELVEHGFISLIYTPTSDNWADCLTNPTDQAKLYSSCQILILLF
ncbi:hypothetical protein L7F22_002561 [Adiantum nelumboides]|nr:hypothetical protein [Adiantum nelumboides]